MFRERFTIDLQAREKNGPPPQRTTGVVRINSTHGAQRGGAWRIARVATGRVKTRLTQNRRVIRRSSRSVSSGESFGRSGSSVMPHWMQFPGPLWRTSGCIGQTYTVLTLYFFSNFSEAELMQ